MSLEKYVPCETYKSCRVTKYLVIYIQKTYIFLALILRFTLIDSYFQKIFSVSKIYLYEGTWSVLLHVLKVKQLIAINNDIKIKETILL